MKFSAIAVITAAVVGVGAVPVESGPLSSLQNRASEAIGGVVSFIRREELGTPVVPQQLKRAPPVRFHNARDAEYLRRRKDGDGKGGSNPVPPLNPFSTKSKGGKRDALEARKKKDPEEVPPLNPFSTGSKEKRGGGDLTRRKAPQESVPPLAPFSVAGGDEE
ncbi:hypothetical protein GCG54_00012758 [Colletotrichum gloeosporioides]|uniref:Uncharacterized protein n=1 Tax=Colletotrichum gloeosporioides TaxID=474922 RepID=A0A8H4CTF1_COLGL|nr:uncharacterized protein GCG54_00012758 [Colletotrichum gloeosporioides]KAF3809476.1 hypothetical protein GCG54_00012758 [Colletotrichum gloeosporioides]